MRGARIHARSGILPVIVDLLLVLLIMVLSGVRLSREGVHVSLPAEAQPPGDPPLDPDIILEYTAERRITLNSEEVSRAALDARLRQIYRARRNKTIWLSGAGSLRYGDVVDVIEAAKEAGVERIGVITPGMRASR